MKLSLLQTYKNIVLSTISNSPVSKTKLLNKALSNLSPPTLFIATDEHSTNVTTVTKRLKNLTQARALDAIISKFIGLSPRDLEEMIGCSSTERKRWMSENLLETAFETSFKYGTFKHSTLFSAASVHRNIDNLREKQKKKNHNNRKNAVIKALATKNENKLKVASNMIAIEKLKSHPKYGDLAYLCLLSQAASRYAKKYPSSEWYVLKDMALQTIINRIPHITENVTLSFYQPASPNKYQTKLCKHHLSEWQRTIRENDYYVDFGDWISVLRSKSNCCKCEFHEIQHYYSLFYVEVNIPDLDIKFSYHLPYPSAKQWIKPSIADLKKVESVNHIENENVGEARFGRKITLIEERTFPADKVSSEIILMCEKYAQ